MMQLKDLFTALAVPACCIAAALPNPQDPVEPGFPNVGNEDIVGGVSAAAGDFPFIVTVLFHGKTDCGGTLLNANTVVTAAHCLSGESASKFTVRAGSLKGKSGGTLVKVSSIITHPGYSDYTLDNDVGIMKLATPIPMSSTISYGILPAANSDPAADSIATVAGWGSTRETGGTSRVLRKVDVPIISRASCRTSYSNGPVNITTSMICAGYAAGGKDDCAGDSGGPLLSSTKTLIGIVSWGRGCAEANSPGVYSRVSVLLPFIQANLA